MRSAVPMAMLLLLISCAGTGRPAKPPTETDYTELAEHILHNTPEHTHFAKGMQFSWCLFIPPQNEELPALTEKVLARLRKRYMVYLSEEDIPANKMLFREGRMAGFRNGFMYRFEIEPVGARRIRIHYFDWESELAASQHAVTYEWSGRTWRPLDRTTRTSG